MAEVVKFLERFSYDVRSNIIVISSIDDHWDYTCRLLVHFADLLAAEIRVDRFTRFFKLMMYEFSGIPLNGDLRQFRIYPIRREGGHIMICVFISSLEFLRVIQVFPRGARILYKFSGYRCVAGMTYAVGILRLAWLLPTRVDSQFLRRRIFRGSLSNHCAERLRCAGSIFHRRPEFDQGKTRFCYIRSGADEAWWRMNICWMFNSCGTRWSIFFTLHFFFQITWSRSKRTLKVLSLAHYQSSLNPTPPMTLDDRRQARVSDLDLFHLLSTSPDSGSCN